MKILRRFGFVALAFLSIALFLPNKTAQTSTRFAPCVNGSAGGFPCQSVLLQAQVPLNRFSTAPTAASNIWGYVDPDDQREYALIGLSNGTAVVEVTIPSAPRIVGVVRGVPSAWREIKAISFYNGTTRKWDGVAYVVTEGTNGGIQIINLSNLPDKVNQVRIDRDISTAHTVFVSNTDFATGVVLPDRKPYLYLMGANRLQFQHPSHEVPAGRGLTVFSLTNPRDPHIAGRYSDTYVHDVYVETLTDQRAGQCAPGHNPCEVVFAWTGSPGFRIIDFTDKKHPVVLSELLYSGLGFAHSGWISRNKRWLFAFDELDETNLGLNTRIFTFNIADLTRPRVAATWTGPSQTIDHNGYVVGNRLYVSHYSRGLVVFNVTNPTRLREIASFDSRPETDAPGFTGAWGVYPFLPSGNVLISDIERGLFIVKVQ